MAIRARLLAGRIVKPIKSSRTTVLPVLGGMSDTGRLRLDPVHDSRVLCLVVRDGAHKRVAGHAVCGKVTPVEGEETRQRDEVLNVGGFQALRHVARSSSSSPSSRMMRSKSARVRALLSALAARSSMAIFTTSVFERAEQHCQNCARSCPFASAVPLASRYRNGGRWLPIR